MIVLLWSLLVAVPSATAQSKGSWGEIQVVVHPENETSRVTRSQISSMFLGKLTRWPGGSEVMVVDLVEEHSAREIFSRLVHGRSAKDVEKVWLRLMLRGHALPPRVSAPRDVVDFVQTHQGAVGYVAATTPIGGLKILQVVEDPVLRKRVDPIYTNAARREKVRGIVVLKVTVHPNGAVGSVFAVRTLPHGLTQEAIKAVKQWQYEPATLDGRPVKVSIEIAIRFRP